MIQIDFPVYWITALLLLTFPLDWILAVTFAAVFHEICHILMVLLMKGSIVKIRVHPSGCEIDACRMGQWQQFVSILAGPLGSFSLLVLCRMVPKIAICGLLQGLYNMIPVLPLDGGRLLRLLLQRACPQQAEKIMDFIAIASCVAFDLFAIWFYIAVSMGPLPGIFALIWNIKVLSGKIPCKPVRIRVQ